MNTPFGPVISVSALQQGLLQAQESGARPSWVVVDCSFDLMNPAAGRAQHAQVRIPGALYADLDDDLSQKDPSSPAASGGRHPLPTREQFAKKLGEWGIKPDTRVVVYDRNGNMVGGRLWWMLQWCGHAHVAVLDGGLSAWLAAGLPSESGPPAPPTPAPSYALHPPRVQLVTAEQVAQDLGKSTQTIIDARATPRFRGDVEPLDPAAGHIPGALNRPFSDNFTVEGVYHAPEVLRTAFDQLLGQRDPATVVLQCGSGVSAVPNIIAMTLAGYPTPALFAGSWSEWCSDPARPVAKA